MNGYLLSVKLAMFLVILPRIVLRINMSRKLSSRFLKLPQIGRGGGGGGGGGAMEELDKQIVDVDTNVLGIDKIVDKIEQQDNSVETVTAKVDDVPSGSNGF
ncbi:hypothetical protein ACH5RR_001135 [Cinchona calisaya]|uniref:t-SNARE coiled-coil homology domain-containing protein n=1 Tax=Cinchona calisaya TaxID=153742 RepID=A0ABD3B3R2_9GENT